MTYSYAIDQYAFYPIISIHTDTIVYNAKCKRYSRNNNQQFEELLIITTIIIIFGILYTTTNKTVMVRNWIAIDN